MADSAQVVSSRLTALATVVLLLAIAAALGTLAVAIGRWSPALDGAQLIFFYVIPAVASCFLIAALRSRPTVRVSAALLLVTLGACGFASELVATAVIARREAGETYRLSPSIADRVHELRRDGRNSYPTVPGNVLVELAPAFHVDSTLLRPLSPAPGSVTAVLCVEDSVSVTLETDRFGFNNPDTLWSGEVHALLIGDSYTQGVCVPHEDQVAQRLGRPGVLNLGFKGAGPLLELAVLTEYGTVAEPPVVFWIYFEGNDPYDLAGERDRDWLTAYLDEGYTQNLAARQDQLDALYRVWIDSLLASGPPVAPVRSTRGAAFALMARAARLTTLRSLAGLAVAFPPEDSPVDILRQILSRAADQVGSWGGSLYFVYLPSYNRFQPSIGEPIFSRRAVLEAATDQGLTVIDLEPAFRATGAPQSLWTHPLGHLTPEGYGFVADALRGVLEQTSARSAAGSTP